MSRPTDLADQDILRLENLLLADPHFPHVLLESPTLKEVCLAGVYLAEELFKLNCPPQQIVQIQYSAGKLSVSQDPWAVVQDLIQQYSNNSLIFQ